MKTADSFQIGQYIKAKQNDDTGIWYLSHPTPDGGTVTYSTGIKGNKVAIRKYIEEAKVQDLVETALRTQLTRAVIDKLTGGKKSWADMLVEWESWNHTTGKSPRTISRHRYDVERWITEMKLENTPIRDIKPDSIYRWVNQVDSTTKGSTRSVMLQSVRGFFRFAVAHGYTDHDPSSLISVRQDILSHQQKEPKAVCAFTLNEVRKILSEINNNLQDISAGVTTNQYKGERKVIRRKSLESKQQMMQFWKASVNLSYGAGLRRSDVAQLEWASVASGWLIVHTEKTDARIAIPYTREAIEAHLKTIPQKERRDVIEQALMDSSPFIEAGIASMEVEDLKYCFPEMNRIYNEQPTKFSVYFMRLLQGIGIRGKSFHGLRHTRIQKWKKLGLEIEDIGKLVGHKHSSTTQIYLKEEAKE